MRLQLSFKELIPNRFSQLAKIKYFNDCLHTRIAQTIHYS